MNKRKTNHDGAAPFPAPRATMPKNHPVGEPMKKLTVFVLICTLLFGASLGAPAAAEEARFDANEELKEFIIENEKAIYSVINRYRRYYEIEDLYQTAVIGIIKAWENYDASRKAKFLTYAYKYMLGEVISYVNKNRSLKISKDILSLYPKLEEAKTILTQKLMKEPTTYELSLFLEIDENIIIRTIEAVKESESLDKVISDDGKTLTLLDTVKDIQAEEKAKLLYLKEAVESLPEPERSIIIERYYNDKTQEEIAKKMGMYQVQVSRSSTKGLKKLKKILQETP